MRALGLLLLLVLPGCAHLPVEVEKAVGKPELMILETAFDARTHPKLDEIGGKIFRASDLTRDVYQFKLIYSREINAMAMPGGYIYVFLGLTEIIDTEDELAGILAHEVAHVAKRHMAQRYDWQLPFILVGQTVPWITSGVVPNPVELAFSRNAESEADIKALEYMTRAGYCPRGMEEIMRKFVEMYGLSQYVKYLETHPPSHERLTEIRNWLQEKDMEQCMTTPLDTNIFLRFSLNKNQ